MVPSNDAREYQGICICMIQGLGYAVTSENAMKGTWDYISALHYHPYKKRINVLI